MQGKRYVIWIALAAVILLTGGCGRAFKEKNNISAEDAAAAVYSGNTLPVYDHIAGSVQDIIVQHGRVGIMSLEWLDDAYTKFRRHFYVMDTADAEPLEIPLSLAQEELLQAYTLDQNGNLIYITSKGETEISSMQLIKTDISGKELARQTLHLADNNIKAVFVDTQDRVYLVQAQTIMVLDADMETLATLRGGKNRQDIDSVAFSNNGKMLCGWRETEAQQPVLHVREMGDACSEWGESYDIPLNKSMTDDQLLMNGWGSYDFCYKDQDGIYGYMTGKGESVRLLDYEASCIAENETWKLETLGTEAYIGMVYEDTGDPQVVVYRKVDPEIVAQRTMVVVGVFGADEDVKKAVTQFNKSHTEYQVTLRDYLEAEDPILQMNTEITAGNAPDVLDVSYISLNQYIKKGLLEDLLPYIEQDPDIAAEDLIPSVRDVLTDNGKIYYVAPEFTLYTIAARASDVGTNVGWTIQDMQEVVSQHKDTDMFYLRDKSDVLYTLLEMQVSDYVDWSTGACSFDSEAFRGILKLANDNGVEMTAQKDGGLKEELSAIRNGQVMFWEGCVDLARLYMNRKTFGEDVTYIGYPDADREGSYMQFQHPYAIYSGSKEKQAAWEFIRIFMTKEYQSGMDLYGSAMPTRQDCFDLMMEANLAQESYVNEMGQSIIPGELWSMYSMVYNGTAADENPIAQEDADTLYELVNRTKRVVSYEDDLMQIIQEEAQAYFAGDRELEDTVIKIQKRAEVYVNENR